MAARAKVSKGLPYLYFKTKEELFKAVIRSVITPLFDAMRERMLSTDLSCEAFLKGPFLAFLQELVLSRRVLIAGWRLAYEPHAVVRHSHPYTIGAAFRRFFDSGVSAERAYLGAAEPSRSVLRRTALDYMRRELGWLIRSGNARWIPYASVYELAKLAGLQLGARHRSLPMWLKLRCTMNPAYWGAP